MARLIAGRVINKVSWKGTLYIGMFLFLLTTCIYYFVTGLNILYTLRFVNGAAYGIASTATGTIIVLKEGNAVKSSLFALPVGGKNLSYRSKHRPPMARKILKEGNAVKGHRLHSLLKVKIGVVG